MLALVTAFILPFLSLPLGPSGVDEISIVFDRGQPGFAEPSAIVANAKPDLKKVGFRMWGGGDCRALLRGSDSYCKTGDCKAILRNSDSYCDSGDCKAYLRGSDSYCETKTCKALLRGSDSYCE